jgi:hypothetical protein
MGIGLGIGINRSNYAQGIFGAYQSRVIADGGVTEGGACVDAVSGLLLTASLLLIPSGYKSGKAYAQIPTNGNGDLTWTRASTAVRTNSTGLLESMGSGVPRLSYMYGSCPALLLEPQRTNLALYSEDFSNATWTKVAGTVASNSTSAPDGNTTADTFTSSLTTNSIVVRTVSITSGSTYSLSFYVKQGTQKFVYIRFTSNALSNNFVSVVYDLQDGTVGQTQVGSSSGTLVSASVQSAGNGFYRLVLVASINQIDGNIGIGFASAKTGNTFNNFGGITSTITSGNDFYLYGAQLELGAYPTTYIPTTTASATRVADTATKTGISSLIGQTSGTIFVDFQYNQDPTDPNGRLLQLWETNDTTNAIVPLINQNNQFQLSTFGSGVGSAIIGASSSTVISTGRNKIAITYTSSSVVVYKNGVLFVSGNPTGFFPTSLTSLDLGGSSFATRILGSPINKFALFKTVLTSNELIELTTL